MSEHNTGDEGRPFVLVERRGHLWIEGIAASPYDLGPAEYAAEAMATFLAQRDFGE